MATVEGCTHYGGGGGGMSPKNVYACTTCHKSVATECEVAMILFHRLAQRDASIIFILLSRNFAKLDKFKKSKIKLDLELTTIQIFFCKPITDMDRTLKSQYLINITTFNNVYKQNMWDTTKYHYWHGNILG